MANGVLFLDLRRAVNTVDHKIVLTKFEFYGFEGPTLNWFHLYLANKQQLSCVKGVNSTAKMTTLESSRFQGSFASFKGFLSV